MRLATSVSVAMMWKTEHKGIMTVKSAKDSLPFSHNEVSRVAMRLRMSLTADEVYGDIFSTWERTRW